MSSHFSHLGEIEAIGLEFAVLAVFFGSIACALVILDMLAG